MKQSTRIGLVLGALTGAYVATHVWLIANVLQTNIFHRNLFDLVLGMANEHPEWQIVYKLEPMELATTLYLITALLFGLIAGTVGAVLGAFIGAEKNTASSV